jgi:hypothetical protein
MNSHTTVKTGDNTRDGSDIDTSFGRRTHLLAAGDPSNPHW